MPFFCSSNVKRELKKWNWVAERNWNDAITAESVAGIRKLEHRVCSKNYCDNNAFQQRAEVDVESEFCLWIGSQKTLVGVAAFHNAHALREKSECNVYDLEIRKRSTRFSGKQHRRRWPTLWWQATWLIDRKTIFRRALLSLSVFYVWFLYSWTVILSPANVLMLSSDNRILKVLFHSRIHNHETKTFQKYSTVKTWHNWKHVTLVFATDFPSYFKTFTSQ